MASAKPPTHIELQPEDAAFTIRASGGLEMLMASRPMEAAEPMSEDCLVLAGFALGFRDERVRSLIGQLVLEKGN